MIDDIKTVREVSAYLRGINERLGLMTKVFAGSVGIGAACLAYLFQTTTTTVAMVTRIENTLVHHDKCFDEIGRRFEQVDKRFDEMDGRFSDVDRQFEEIKVLLRSLQPR